MSLQLLPIGNRSVVLPPTPTALSGPSYRSVTECAGAAPSMRVAHGRRLLRASDPATGLITDFTQERTFAIEADREINAALDDMFRLGVPGLLVARADTVVGLITACDIHNARMCRLTGQPNLQAGEGVPVSELMTRAEKFAALDWQALSHARARDILDVFRRTDVTHLIFLEERVAGSAVARGLLWRARLERQLEQWHFGATEYEDLHGSSLEYHDNGVGLSRSVTLD